MKARYAHSIFPICLMSIVATVSAETVISDQGVSLSREELEYVVSQWPPQMQQAAANDLGDRLELLNQAVASKKIASEADKLTPERDGDVYWQKEMMVRAALQQFMVSRFMASIEVPDMSALAEERYNTEKGKYAWVPPSRLSSHILLRCGAGVDCDPLELQARAEELLLELRAGADFEAMVLEYSEDPGSRLKKGLFDKWLQAGMDDVESKYLKGVFTIENVGDYSEVVATNFGYHIIRLDGVKEGYYKSFNEVKGDIISALANEYGRLAVKTFDESYRFSDDLVIQGEAMDEIFEKYRLPE